MVSQGAKAVKNGLKFELRTFILLSQVPSVVITKNIPYVSIFSLYGNNPTRNRMSLELII